MLNYPEECIIIYSTGDRSKGEIDFATDISYYSSQTLSFPLEIFCSTVVSHHGNQNHTNNE